MSHVPEIYLLAVAVAAGTAHSIYGRSVVRALTGNAAIQQYHPFKRAIYLLLQGIVSACAAVPIALIGCLLFESVTSGGYWNELIFTPSFYLMLSSLAAFSVWGVKLWLRSHPHLHMHTHYSTVEHSGFNERRDERTTRHEHMHNHLGEHNHYHLRVPSWYRILGTLGPSEVVVPVAVFAVLAADVQQALAAAIAFGSTEALFFIVFYRFGSAGRVSGLQFKYAMLYAFLLISILCGALAVFIK